MFIIRGLAAVITGALAGLVLAALICWIWLAAVDGHELDW